MTKGDSVNDIFTCLDGIRANIFDEYVTSLGLKAPIFCKCRCNLYDAKRFRAC